MASSARGSASAAAAASAARHVGRPGPRGPADATVQLSKALSYLLRHGAEREHVPMRPDGFVAVDDVLRLPRFRQYTLADVRHVVADNDKQRFTLTEAPDGRAWIKANQGHSLHVEQLELERVDDPAELPVVVHGTTFAAWGLIRASGHLSRMGRQHMHFAAGLPGASGVISGMRRTAEVHIYVDAARAMADGVVFLRSPNGVILTEGLDGGKLPLKYVDYAVRANGQLLPLEQP